MLRALLAALLLVTASAGAEARDTEYMLKLDELTRTQEYRQKVGSDIAFSFGKQATPPVLEKLGQFVANRKSNSFGRPDEVACERAALSALIELREYARKLGGNAVINIESYYKKTSNPSETQYECHAGGVIAGVAFRGEVVKLKK